MHPRLSERVEKVIKKLSEEIAREYEQEYVGTEHVLLAILRDGTGVGAKVLNARKIDEKRARAEVDKLVQKSMEETWVFGRLPGSPHFKNVVARAIDEATTLGSSEVRTEHILLGLLHEKGSVAYEALRTLGLTLKSARQDIVKATNTKGPREVSS